MTQLELEIADLQQQVLELQRQVLELLYLVNNHIEGRLFDLENPVDS